MRVISQDREYSVDFDRTPFWLEGQCVYATVGNKSILFATYKFADRAKEVFLEMHSVRTSFSCQIIYYMPKE